MEIMSICLLAEVISGFVALIVTIFIVYKILDHIVRIPHVGNYKYRYILVTGCDTGFGNLIAKRLDQLECHVFAGCLTEKGETELKKACSERLHVISLDVTRKESVRKALEYVEGRLPEGRGRSVIKWLLANLFSICSHYSFLIIWSSTTVFPNELCKQRKLRSVRNSLIAHGPSRHNLLISSSFVFLLGK